MTNSNGNHSFFEIMYQDKTLAKTLDLFVLQTAQINSFFSHDFDEIVFVACGSSYLLSLSGAETFFQKTGKRCFVTTAGDVVLNKELYKSRYKSPLIIAPSRSGKTTETIEAVTFLKQEYGCKVLSIVAYLDSELERLSDLTLNIHWANETSVCQTQSFSNLYLAVVLLSAIAVADEQLIKELQAYVSKFESLRIAALPEIQRVLQQDGLRNLIVLGTGKLFGIACEAAYISIEMAQWAAHYFYTLEFRHGPIVMIDKSYLVILISDGRNAKEEDDLLGEIKKNGASTLVISATGGLNNAHNHFAYGDLVQPEIIGLYASFIGQAIAYFKALSLGLNPDQPKDLVPWINLAK